MPSVLAGEKNAFVDAFDSSYAIRHDLSKMLQTKVPLNLITHSKWLFRVVTQSITTTEKRFMIYLQACLEGKNERSTDNVGWVKSEKNLADGFTKFDKANLLQQVMRTGSL